MNFDSTITEADWDRPLLDAHEEQIVRELRSEPDLHVEGLSNSWLVRLLGLFSRDR